MHKIHSIDRIEGFRQLSARETQLIVLASEGLTDKEIARFLGISNGTVVTMWSRMRAKLGISSRVSAVAVVVSAVSRLCERARSLRGVSDEWSTHRILVSPKHIALSCDEAAVNRLGIRPGHSVTAQMLAGFTNKDGAPLTEGDLPWFQDKDIVLEVVRASQCYTVECTAAEDATLGRTILVEFTPVKACAVAESIHFRLAAAK